ncbi:MAG: hypothetical protein J6M65_06855 [Eubacterium sp.]|nr:hypothetical protein [Eubacterium sp.]
MKQSDIKILLVLLAIGLIVASIFLVARPKNDSIKALQSEISELQARYDDLCAKESQKDQFIAETKEFNEKFDAEVIKYAPDLDQENTLMFLKGVEETHEFQNISASLPQPSTYYVLGQGSTAEGATVSEDPEEAANQYVVLVDSYSINYKGSYEDLKNYLDYIAGYKYRMNISTINIAYSSDAANPIDECTGSLTLNEYAITGPDRNADVPSIELAEGKEVIFEDENGGSKASTTHDADNGDSIVSDHNLVILLNNANSDTTSGIIVASSESDENTYVSSTANSEQNLDISITEEDGKKYISYAIGAASKKVEVLTSDITIFVKSSARVDSNDTNGVNVSINNSTDISVFVKVSDDDATSPRFKIGNKTGVVKVY